MAGLYNRMVDPNFATPNGTGVSPNAGLGAPGGAGLPGKQADNFDPTQMAGLLGMLAKKKKPGEEGADAAPGAAPGAAQPGMAPIGNQGNFDMAPAMAQGAGALPNGGNFAMPPAGSGEAFQLGGMGTGTPMSNFGGGVPAEAPQIPAAMPQSIGGAGIPQLSNVDLSQLQNIQVPFAQGGFGFGFGGGAGAM